GRPPPRPRRRARARPPPGGRAHPAPRGAPVAGSPRPPPPDGSAAPTEQEQLIVLGARAIVDLVRERGYDTRLAGIGTSHMSAWLAARLLGRDGVQVQVAGRGGRETRGPRPRGGGGVRTPAPPPGR
ncbi:hypothetical protein ACFWIP_34865, partial [Streptomyces anulatus]